MKKVLKFLFSEWRKSFRLEKRTFERKEISVRVVFIVVSRRSPDRTSNSHDAIGCDISEQGMSLLVDNLRYDGHHIWKDDSFMDPNIIRLAFHLRGEDEPIEAEAEVVNFSLAGPRAIKRYKIGVRFTKISRESISVIIRFLARKS